MNIPAEKINFNEPILDYFEDHGCRLDEDETYEDMYGIQCEITRIKGIHAAVNLGLHFTNRRGDHETQENFLLACERGVIRRGLFFEICVTDLRAGAIPIIHAVCIAHLFRDKDRARAVKARGVRIFDDLSYQFFELGRPKTSVVVSRSTTINRRSSTTRPQDADRRAEEMMAKAMDSSTGFLQGSVIHYDTMKGFGFLALDPDDPDSPRFFFHYSQVNDDSLRNRLSRYVRGDQFDVRFKEGAREGDGKYPQALSVEAAR